MWRLLIYAFVSMNLNVAPVLAERVYEGIAIVKDDGTIALEGRRFGLFGIRLAALGRDCRTVVRPVRCAERSVLVLESLITGFLHCQPIAKGRAVCTKAGERMFDERIDLAIELLKSGFAYATPDAPASYRRWEAVAKSRGLGIWGGGFVDIR